MYKLTCLPLVICIGRIGIGCCWQKSTRIFRQYLLAFGTWKTPRIHIDWYLSNTVSTPDTLIFLNIGQCVFPDMNCKKNSNDQWTLPNNKRIEETFIADLPSTVYFQKIVMGYIKSQKYMRVSVREGNILMIMPITFHRCWMVDWVVLRRYLTQYRLQWKGTHFISYKQLIIHSPVINIINNIAVAENICFRRTWSTIKRTIQSSLF